MWEWQAQTCMQYADKSFLGVQPVEEERGVQRHLYPERSLCKDQSTGTSTESQSSSGFYTKLQTSSPQKQIKREESWPVLGCLITYDVLITWSFQGCI